MYQLISDPLELSYTWEFLKEGIATKRIVITRQNSKKFVRGSGVFLKKDILFKGSFAVVSFDYPEIESVDGILYLRGANSTLDLKNALCPGYSESFFFEDLILLKRTVLGLVRIENV